MILDRILDHKKRELAARMSAAPVEELRARLTDAPPALDFSHGLLRNTDGLPAVIAEVKKASPSKGVIREDFDPVPIAKAYEAGGAAAISVLTDEEFFQGSLEYLTAVKQAVSIPVVRKDFVIDNYQLVEARAAGADAVLLIVAALEMDTLARLLDLAGELGMQCLVETHDEREMETALEIGAGLIGINNRNLYTFDVTLETTKRLAPLVTSFDKLRMPTSAVKTRLVSESGIFTKEDMAKLGAAGVDAVLVGEALMRSEDIEAKLRELTR